MDRDYKYYNSPYTQLGEMDRIVVECRDMAVKLGLIIRYKRREKTAIASIKFNGELLWQREYTDNYAHRMLLQMYCGVHTELSRRKEENTQALLRMRKLEEERAEERAAANLPNWAERNKS